MGERYPRVDVVFDEHYCTSAEPWQSVKSALAYSPRLIEFSGRLVGETDDGRFVVLSLGVHESEDGEESATLPWYIAKGAIQSITRWTDKRKAGKK